VKKLLFTLFFGLAFVALGQAQTAIRVASYNIENYILSPIQNRPLKTKFAQAKVVESILAAKPDELALQEVGTAQLQSDLKAKGLNLPYVEHLQSFDPAIHVAYLSRFPFKKITKHDNESYLLNGRRLYGGRGFAEVQISVRGYDFSLINAHLKSKGRVPKADQAEMRLQEAYRLRRIVDTLLKADPDINLVVLGDFNDYYNSKPVKAIIGRGKARLIDSRASERNGDSGLNLINKKWFRRDVSWTHFYGVEDVYSRIDYMMLSPGMARELDRANSWIPVVANWGHGSDHRPVVISVFAKDR